LGAGNAGELLERRRARVMAEKKAVFIDRDGVVVSSIMKNGKPCGPFHRGEFEMYPWTENALEKIALLGFLSIMITNQPDVAYGFVTYPEWKWMHRHVEKLPFDDIFVCMHTYGDGCECKKPKPGMILEAAKKWDIDLSCSYMIGDTEADTRAAQAAGVKSILIDKPYNRNIKSDYRAASLMGAVDLIKRLQEG